MSASVLLLRMGIVAIVAFFVQPARAQDTQGAREVSGEQFARLVDRYQAEVPLWRLLRSSSLSQANDSDALTRSRLRGLLPQLRVGARVRQGNDLLQVQTDDSGRLNLSSDEQLTFDIELRFSLDRLLYDSAEPALLRQRAAIEERRQHQRERIVELYFEWVQLSAERDLRGSVSLDQHGRINLIAARLNLFTNGAFFRMLRGSRRAHHE